MNCREKNWRSFSLREKAEDRAKPWFQPGETGPSYSVMTVDWPVSSNRFRQRIFLQAIMSSLRTM